MTDVDLDEILNPFRIFDPVMLAAARDLCADAGGENPEYVRACAELLIDTTKGASNDQYKYLTKAERIISKVLREVHEDRNNHLCGFTTERRICNALEDAGLIEKQERTARHNHFTRDIKPLGECPVCDEYHTKEIPQPGESTMNLLVNDPIG